MKATQHILSKASTFRAVTPHSPTVTKAAAIQTPVAPLQAAKPASTTASTQKKTALRLHPKVLPALFFLSGTLFMWFLLHS